jgi:lysozyme family protein
MPSISIAPAGGTSSSYGLLEVQDLATKVFDTAVNVGSTQAHKFLQRALVMQGYKAARRRGARAKHNIGRERIHRALHTEVFPRPTERVLPQADRSQSEAHSVQRRVDVPGQFIRRVMTEKNTESTNEISLAVGTQTVKVQPKKAAAPETTTTEPTANTTPEPEVPTVAEPTAPLVTQTIDSVVTIQKMKAGDVFTYLGYTYVAVDFLGETVVRGTLHDRPEGELYSFQVERVTVKK